MPGSAEGGAGGRWKHRNLIHSGFLGTFSTSLVWLWSRRMEWMRLKEVFSPQTDEPRERCDLCDFKHTRKFPLSFPDVSVVSPDGDQLLIGSDPNQLQRQ